MEDVFAVYDKMTYGLVKVSFGHMKCLTCPENCSHPKQLEDILKKYENMENSDICDSAIQKREFHLSYLND